MVDVDASPAQDNSPPVFGATAQALAPLLEHIRDGCVFIDGDLRVGFLNAVARRDVIDGGDDPGRVPGTSVWEFLLLEPGTPPRIAIENAARERLPTHFTSMGVYSGRSVEIDVVPIPDGMVLYYRDVTPQFVAEQARAASESELRMTSERLRVLIDEAPLAVIVTDTAARVLHWNPAAAAMFQWTAAEVVGQPLPTIPDDEIDSFQEHTERTANGESVKALTARRRRKDGVTLDVQISSAPMRDQHGMISGNIVMISDVTAHRKLEAQLRMAQKMEAVGLLAGGVAHDFNNLLTAIKGFTTLLQMTLDESDQASEFLGEINKAADRAASLTAQLLAFSRRQLLRPEPLDLNARVRDLERMLRLLLREDGQLVLDLDPHLNEVLADPGQIEQVILNLVVNARDAIHGREDGTVTIRTTNAELRDEFSLWGVLDAPGQYVRLDVIDNGTGMDRSTQTRIFDPFFTTKEPGQGTGLGLATVFGIVKQSGGYVWVESKLAEGSSFSVYLPRAKGRKRTSGPLGLSAGGGNELILLVEDEASVRRVARRALELHGYTIIDAPDGPAALALIEGREIDLLLTDVMMPGMLGPEVAAEVLIRRPGTPVLFMSGHSDEIVRGGLLDPDTPFLAKPFTPKQLALKVREALDSAPAAAGEKKK